MGRGSDRRGGHEEEHTPIQEHPRDKSSKLTGLWEDTQAREQEGLATGMGGRGERNRGKCSLENRKRKAQEEAL